MMDVNTAVHEVHRAVLAHAHGLSDDHMSVQDLVEGLDLLMDNVVFSLHALDPKSETRATGFDKDRLRDAFKDTPLQWLLLSVDLYAFGAQQVLVAIHNRMPTTDELTTMFRAAESELFELAKTATPVSPACEAFTNKLIQHTRTTLEEWLRQDKLFANSVTQITNAMTTANEDDLAKKPSATTTTTSTTTTTCDASEEQIFEGTRGLMDKWIREAEMNETHGYGEKRAKRDDN
jgi:hypothetical protein